MNQNELEQNLGSADFCTTMLHDRIVNDDDDDDVTRPTYCWFILSVDFFNVLIHN